MADIAEIGFAADTSALKDAKASMEAMVPAATKADNASSKLSATLGKVDAAADKLLAAANGLSGAVDKMSAAMDRTSNATQKVATNGMTASTVMVTFSASGRNAAVALNSAASASVNAASGLNDAASAANSASAGMKNTATAANTTSVSVEKAAISAETLGTAVVGAAAIATKALGSIDGAAENLSGKLAAINAVKNSGSFNVARDRGADIEAYGKSLDDLRAKFNPLYAVIRQYKQNIADIREANRVGAIGADEMAAAISRQRQAGLTAIGAIKGRKNAIEEETKAIGLNRMGQMELIHVAKSLFDSIAAGTNPFRALSFEAGRIGQVISGTNGGIKGILVSLGILKTVSTEAAVAQAALGAASEASAAGAAAAVVGAEAVAAGNEAIATTASEAAVAEGVALAPLGAILLGIAAVLAVIGIGFGLAARKIKSDTGDVTKSMDLTRQQTDKLHDHLDRLKDKKINVEVTGGDTFKAFFKTIGDYAGDSNTFKSIKSSWSTAMDWITEKGKAAARMVIGTFDGLSQAISASTTDIPAQIGDAFITAANYGIDALNGLIKWIEGIPGSVSDAVQGVPSAFGSIWTKAVNLAGDAINWLVDKASKFVDLIRDNWRAIPGIIAGFFYDAANKAIAGISSLFNKIVSMINTLGGHLKNGDFGHIENPFAGAISGANQRGIAAFKKGYKEGGDAVDEFGRRWERNAKKIAQQRILREVGPAGRSPHEKKEKKDPWEELINGANADTAKEAAKAAAAGIDMTALAAATLEQKTKLLSEAQSKGIVIDAAKAKKIDELAAAYGRAKVAADNAVGLRDVLKGGDKDIADLKAQADMIGVYGRQLAYATEMAKLLGEAKAKNMTPDAIAAATPQFQDKANKVADASETNNQKKFMEDARQGYLQNTEALKQQQAAIGLSADATTRLQYEQKYLNDAMAQHIQLTPEMIASLKGMADEQANTENAIRKTKEALDFTRDTTKGFVSDLRSGLAQGENLFSAFAKAATNALDKVLDKLIDLTLDSALGGGGLGVGGFAGALGKLFGIGGKGGSTGVLGASDAGSVFGSGAASAGGPISFAAKGNAFDRNGITMFANGSALSNGVVDTPTAFAFGRNANKTGVLGEAGPEAVMPLVRGNNGSLGVQMHGGSGNGAQTNHIQIDARSTYHVGGVTTPEHITQAIRAGGQQTEATVKKSLGGWLAQQQRDGAVS